MISLAVLETGAKGDIAAIITERLSRLPHPGVTFIGRGSMEAGAVPDIFVVSRRAGEKPPHPLGGSCGTLLVPGAAIDLAALIGADFVVSYGMSKKDSVTLSSIGEGEIVLSLQRELPTISGRPLERQDIPVRAKSPYSPEDVMAGAAALLLLGLAPEELM